MIIPQTADADKIAPRIIAVIVIINAPVILISQTFEFPFSSAIYQNINTDEIEPVINKYIGFE